MGLLPPPAEDQAYVDVSALEAGMIEIPREWVIDNATPGERIDLPALSFLLRHSKKPDETFVFDLGIRKDLQNFTPEYLERIKHMTFDVTVPEDAVDALAKGGLAPSDITHILVSIPFTLLPLFSPSLSHPCNLTLHSS